MWNVKKGKEERNYGEEKVYCSGRPVGLVLMPYLFLYRRTTLSSLIIKSYKLPHKANHQRQRHLKSNHPLLKKHVPLGCLVPSQQARKSTANFAQQWPCRMWMLPYNQRHNFILYLMFKNFEIKLGWIELSASG